MFNKIIHLVALSTVYKTLNIISSEDYVLLKKNNKFPYLSVGNDLDIFVKDVKLVEDSFYESFNRIFFFKINKLNKSESNINLDIYFKKNFLIKLDISSDLSQYENLKKQNEFAMEVLNKKEIFKYNFLFRTYFINVPANDFDIIIRYFEFLKYPKKLQHLKFLKSIPFDKIEEINSTYRRYLNNNIDIKD